MQKKNKRKKSLYTKKEKNKNKRKPVHEIYFMCLCVSIHSIWIVYEKYICGALLGEWDFDAADDDYYVVGERVKIWSCREKMKNDCNV